MYPTGTTLLEVAESIGMRLAKDAVAAQLNGKLTDLTEAIDIDADINIFTDPSGNTINNVFFIVLINLSTPTK